MAIKPEISRKITKRFNVMFVIILQPLFFNPMTPVRLSVCYCLVITIIKNTSYFIRRSVFIVNFTKLSNYSQIFWVILSHLLFGPITDSKLSFPYVIYGSLSKDKIININRSNSRLVDIASSYKRIYGLRYKIK